jgi:hypothetical protein
MMERNIIFGLLFAVLTVVSGYAEFQPPKILPQADYMIVKAGQTGTFSCQGTLNGVSWRLPEDASKSLKRRITISYTTNHQYFIAELVIRDLTYNDTGTLTCAYNGTADLTAIDNSSSIHLYVEDGQHLLKHSGFDFLQAVQYQTFILPCMPTRPDVNITLWRNGQRVYNDDHISYDPKVCVIHFHDEAYINFRWGRATAQNIILLVVSHYFARHRTYHFFGDIISYLYQIRYYIISYIVVEKVILI